MFDRSDAGVLLEAGCVGIPGSVRAKGGEQAGCGGWSRTRQALEQCGLGMGLEGLCDALLNEGDVLLQRPQDIDEHLDL